MPKNIGIGGKNKKKGKKFNESGRELQFKEEGEEYGQNVRLLGDCRLEILCPDGVKRAGHIKGSLRKKVFINMGDIVLVSIREFEPEKCDILLKYTEDEVRKLKKAGEIPENFKLPSKDDDNNENNEDFLKFEKKEDDNEEEEDEEDDDKRNNNDDLDDLEDMYQEDEDKEVEEEEEEGDIDFDDDGKNKSKNVKASAKFASGKQNKTNRQNGQDKKNYVDDL